MVRQISTLAWMTYKEAAHGRLIWVIGFSVLLLVAAVEFAGEVIVSGVAALQAGMLGWGMRWLGVITISLFCINSVAREANDRVGELFVAAPVRREVLYLGRMLGLVAIAAIFAGIAFASALIYVEPLVALSWALSL